MFTFDFSTSRRINRLAGSITYLIVPLSGPTADCWMVQEFLLLRSGSMLADELVVSQPRPHASTLRRGWSGGMPTTLLSCSQRTWVSQWATILLCQTHDHSDHGHWTKRMHEQANPKDILLRWERELLGRQNGSLAGTGNCWACNYCSTLVHVTNGGVRMRPCAHNH